MMNQDNVHLYFLITAAGMFQCIWISPNIEGLNTVGMLIDKPKTFYKGDSYELDCVVLAPELFENSIIIGSKGKLWEVGYFADVTVIKIYNDGWPSAS